MARRPPRRPGRRGAHRAVTDTDVAHDDRAAAAEPAVETGVPDLRQVSRTDATEHTDPARGHVLCSSEAAVAVARAQTALAEIAARRAADEQREAEEAAEQTRRDELGQWAAEPDGRDPAQRDAADDADDAADW